MDEETKLPAPLDIPSLPAVSDPALPTLNSYEQLAARIVDALEIIAARMPAHSTPQMRAMPCRPTTPLA